MTAPLSDVLARIALLQRNLIDPVTSVAVQAFDNVPFTISRADMPLFINIVKPLTRNELVGSDDKGRDFNEVRTYDMILYHSPAAGGISEENIGLLTPWFDLVYIEFGKWPHLQQLDGIINALIVTDGGVSVQEFIGQQYYGIRFSLQVTRRTRYAFGKGD